MGEGVGSESDNWVIWGRGVAQLLISLQIFEIYVKDILKCNKTHKNVLKRNARRLIKSDDWVMGGCATQKWYLSDIGVNERPMNEWYDIWMIPKQSFTEYYYKQFYR